MSDYLWDGTGEADAEVERLEELLGRLRDTRVAPELPLGLEARAPTRAGLFSPAGFSRPARFAVAAGLLLALLAGAFVMLRSSKTGVGRASVNNETQGPKQQPPAHQQASAPQGAHEREEPNAHELVASPQKESASPEETPHENAPRDALASEKLSPKQQRREPPPRLAVANADQRREIKPAFASRESYDGGASDVESDAERRVRAKEQLVYALRLTGEALREVRGRTKGVAATNAFDGRSPVR